MSERDVRVVMTFTLSRIQGAKKTTRYSFSVWYLAGQNIAISAAPTIFDRPFVRGCVSASSLDSS